MVVDCYIVVVGAFFCQEISKQGVAHRSKRLGFDPFEFGITMWCKPDEVQR